MMLKNFFFGLSFKIVAVLLFYISAVAIMAIVSYDDLMTTEKKVGVLEIGRAHV